MMARGDVLAVIVSIKFVREKLRLSGGSCAVSSSSSEGGREELSRSDRPDRECDWCVMETISEAFSGTVKRVSVFVSVMS